MVCFLRSEEHHTIDDPNVALTSFIFKFKPNVLVKSTFFLQKEKQVLYVNEVVLNML